jgi:hypothetical protein
VGASHSALVTRAVALLVNSGLARPCSRADACSAFRPVAPRPDRGFAVVLDVLGMSQRLELQAAEPRQLGGDVYAVGDMGAIGRCG